MVDRLHATLNPILKSPLQQASTGQGASANPADSLPADDLGLTNQRRKTATQLLQGQISQQGRISPAQDIFKASGETAGSAQGVSLLASVRTRGGCIGLNAILEDFNNTTQALGADAQTQAEVDTYLNVVKLQGQSGSPNISLIQQSLSSAALSLDRFIAQALTPEDSERVTPAVMPQGKAPPPAPVVQEWVDALLSQNIDYRFKAGSVSPSGLSAEAAAMQQTFAPETVSDRPIPLTDRSAGDMALKQHLAQTIQQTQTAATAGDWQTALAAVNNGIEQLTQAEAKGETFRPDVRGKLAMMKAGVLMRSGQSIEPVLTQYQQAATAFSEASLPHKEAQALHAMAAHVEQYANTTGQSDLLDSADTLYSEATQLNRATGQPLPLIQSLNDWANLRLNRGDAQGAIPLWTEAVKVSGHVQNPGLSADLWHNLGQVQGQVGNRSQALGAFQNSLQQRFNANDRLGYAATLNAMAQWAETSGRPGAASELRNRSQRLAARN